MFLDSQRQSSVTDTTHLRHVTRIIAAHHVVISQLQNSHYFVGEGADISSVNTTRPASHVNYLKEKSAQKQG